MSNSSITDPSQRVQSRKRLVWERASSQFLRAMRGSRSQIALARRLGFRGNPIANWETGRRFPTAAEALQACQASGIDVAAAFRRFHPPTADLVDDITRDLDDTRLATWLSHLRGAASVGELAERSGLSRYRIARWLRGDTRPRLPDFFRMVEAATGRASDLVAYLVDIDQVPALSPVQHRRAATRRLAVDEPWTEAIMRLLETEDYRALESHTEGWIADRLGIDETTEQWCLELMEAAGIIARRDGLLVQTGRALTVDTTGDPEANRRLKVHWCRAAEARMAAPVADDLLSYNVISVSRKDLQRVREILRSAFREIRSLVAASEPVQVAALVQLQLLSWDPRAVIPKLSDSPEDSPDQSGSARDDCEAD